MADVFISYSRQNSAFARRLIDSLSRDNKDSWVDWEGIPLTAPNWWHEIRTGIEYADSFIFIMSPASMASVVCNLELDYALELNKRIIPIVYEEVVSRHAFASIADFEPDEAMEERLAGNDPLIMARDNWQSISHINWVYLREEDDFETGYKKLLQIAETDLSYVKAHTRYLTRAQEWQRENQRSDLLLFGEEITRAEAWLQQAETYAGMESTDAADVVNPLAQDIHRVYIQASRAAEQRRRRISRTAQLAIATLVLVMLIGTVLGTSIVASTQQQVAASEIRLTEIAATIHDSENTIYSLNLARRAEEVYPEDNVLGITLALEANRIPNPPALSQSILADLAYAPGLRRRLDEETNSLRRIVILPDGERALAGTSNGALILWDLLTGKEIQRYDGQTGYVTSLTVSDDGEHALSGHRNGSVILWDLSTGNSLSLEGHSNPIRTVAFSPDRTQAIASSFENADSSNFSESFDVTVIYWDAQTGEQADAAFILGDDWIGAAFSPDGTFVLADSSDGILSLLDLAIGDEVQRFDDSAGSLESVAVSPSGELALSGYQDGTIVLWDIVSGIELLKFEGHGGQVFDIAFSSDNRLAVSGACTQSNDSIGCQQSEIIVWNVSSGEELLRRDNYEGSIYSVVFSPDGRSVLSSAGRVAEAASGTRVSGLPSFGDSQITELWDIDQGALLERTNLNVSRLRSAAFSPDGQLLLTGNRDGDLATWDTQTGEPIESFVGDRGTVTSITFSPDGQTALVGHRSRGSIAIWDVVHGISLRHHTYGSGSSIYSTAFSPDGRLGLLGFGSGTLVLWDVASDTQQQLTVTPYPVSSIAFSPSGQHVVFFTCAESVLIDCVRGQLVLMDVSTGEELHIFEGHVGYVNAVAFSHDGKYLLSGDEHGTLILWNFMKQEELFQLDAHGDIRTVAFLPDGRTFVSGSDTISLWDIPSGGLLREFPWPTLSLGMYTDGRHVSAISTSSEYALWRIDSVEQLISWTQQNRVLQELTCDDRRKYGVISRCENGQLPPEPTSAPTGTPFLAPTSPAWTQIAQPTTTFTPEAVGDAGIGENQGKIAVGGAQLWTYSGQAGDIINIRLTSDNFEIYLFVYDQTGELITEAHVGFDRLFENVQIPEGGRFQFEVRSVEEASGGDYVLTIEQPDIPTATPG